MRLLGRSLALALALAACGKYGPPVRASEVKPKAAAGAPAPAPAPAGPDTDPSHDPNATPDDQIL